jgi:xylan 1,4-beta-xylosidase
MSEALSTQPRPYKHSWTSRASYKEIFTGWAYPPKSFKRWEDLVCTWAWHCLDCHELEQGESWYWEVWNEPDIGYWQSTRERVFALHDHAVAAVCRAIPTALIGGRETAQADEGFTFLESFLGHCVGGTNVATGQQGSPLDFIAFHAKGRPEYIDGSN